MTWENLEQQQKAEDLAFKHAASLVREYRRRLNFAKLLNCFLGAVIVVLVMVLAYG